MHPPASFWAHHFLWLEWCIVSTWCFFHAFLSSMGVPTRTIIVHTLQKWFCNYFLSSALHRQQLYHGQILFWNPHYTVVLTKHIGIFSMGLFDWALSLRNLWHFINFPIGLTAPAEWKTQQLHSESDHPNGPIVFCLQLVLVRGNCIKSSPVGPKRMAAKLSAPEGWLLW